jgi:hypothetical protein
MLLRNGIKLPQNGLRRATCFVVDRGLPFYFAVQPIGVFLLILAVLRGRVAQTPAVSVLNNLRV